MEERSGPYHIREHTTGQLIFEHALEKRHCYGCARVWVWVCEYVCVSACENVSV